MEKQLIFNGPSSGSAYEGSIPPARFIRKPEVCSRIGLGNTALYRMISKSLFPAPIHPHGGRTALWLESDVEQWIADQVAAAGRGEIANG